MSQDPVTEHFVRNLTASQNALWAYIYALLPDRDRAWDVLQDTNVVIWSKAADFTPESDFLAWARKIAYFEVCNYRRQQQGDPQLFDPTLLQLLAAESEQHLRHTDERSRLLDDCLDQLPRSQRDLIRQRYEPGGSVKQLAVELGQTAGGVSVSLTRIRRALLDCIQRKLVTEERRS